MADVPSTASPSYNPILVLNRPPLLAYNDVSSGDRFTPSVRSGAPISRQQLQQHWNQEIDRETRNSSPGQLHQTLTEMATGYRNNPDDQFAKYRLHTIAQRANELGDPRLQRRVANLRDLSASARVRPQSQPRHSDWCGITSVAMVSEKLSGRKTSPSHIHARYGYGLQQALDSETGRTWQNKSFNHNSWPAIQKSLAKGRPVIVGTGKPFSSSDRHIFVITGVKGDRVTYADPNGGVIRTTTRKTLDNARPYPQGGKFMFIAS